jgi:hypothetical protein
MVSRTSGDFFKIRGGDIDGTFNGGSGAGFQAPYLVTSAAHGPEEWLRDGWDWARARDNGPDNYNCYIQVLCMIAASGNWWAPE